MGARLPPGHAVTSLADGAPSPLASIVVAALVLALQALLYLRARAASRRPGAGAVAVRLVAAALAAPFLRWQQMPWTDAAALFTTWSALLIAWKYATRDFSLVDDPSLPTFSTPVLGYAERAVLVASALLVYVSPVFALPFLSHARRFQPFHLHELLPIAVVMAAAAYAVTHGGIVLARLVLGETALATGAAAAAPLALYFVLLASIALLYVTRGVAKLYAGRRWHDWMWSNPLHLQLPSAYTWGWLAWLSEPTVLALTRRARRLDRPLATATVALEIGAVLLFVDRCLALCLLAGLILFHLGYFSVSGALFWEYVLVDAGAMAMIAALPLQVADALFAWPATALLGALCALALAAVWPPYLLAWWETPLTQRVYWEVEGESGRTYVLSHAFMDPWESYFYFGDWALVPYRMVTQNLSHTPMGPGSQGMAKDLAAGGPAAVRALADGGRACPARCREIEAFLRQFFAALDAGRRKRVLPHALRWLKAPGCFLARGGPGPVYRGQERAREIRVKYRETFWTGTSLVTLRDEVHRRIGLG
jgi:hypothetical protein